MLVVIFDRIQMQLDLYMLGQHKWAASIISPSAAALGWQNGVLKHTCIQTLVAASRPT